MLTPEQIKTLIDQKIAGQGTMVDVGGALPTILKEIVDMASQGGGSAPIVLNGYLEEGMSLDDLAAIGLTKDEMIAAANGERSGVIQKLLTGTSYYTITNANYSPRDPHMLGSKESVLIVFSHFSFSYNETADIWMPVIEDGFAVSIEDNVPTIAEIG